MPGLASQGLLQQIPHVSFIYVAVWESTNSHIFWAKSKHVTRAPLKTFQGSLQCFTFPHSQVLASKTAVCFLPRGGSSSSWWFFFCRRLLFSLFCLWFNSSCFILSNIAEYRIESLLNVLAFSMTHLTVLSALIDFFLVFMGSALLFIFLFLPSFEFSFPSVPHSFGLHYCLIFYCLLHHSNLALCLVIFLCLVCLSGRALCFLLWKCILEFYSVKVAVWCCIFPIISTVSMRCRSYCICLSAALVSSFCHAKWATSRRILRCNSFISSRSRWALVGWDSGFLCNVSSTLVQSSWFV